MKGSVELFILQLSAVFTCPGTRRTIKQRRTDKSLVLYGSTGNDFRDASGTSASLTFSFTEWTGISCLTAKPAFRSTFIKASDCCRELCNVDLVEISTLSCNHFSGEMALGSFVLSLQYLRSTVDFTIIMCE